MPRLKAYHSGPDRHRVPVGKREAQETEERYRKGGQTRRQLMRARQREYQVELRSLDGQQRRSLRVFAGTAEAAGRRAKAQIGRDYGGRWTVERASPR